MSLVRIKCAFLNYFLLIIFSFRYLQEIGYTDTIIDVRSNRVRSLLGLHDNIGGGDANDDSNSNMSSSNAINGDANACAGRYGGDGTATRRGGPTTLTEEMAIDTEAAVMANFDFLNEGSGIDDDDDMEDGLIGSNEDMKISNVGASTSTGDLIVCSYAFSRNSNESLESEFLRKLEEYFLIYVLRLKMAQLLDCLMVLPPSKKTSRFSNLQSLKSCLSNQIFPVEFSLIEKKMLKRSHAMHKISATEKEIISYFNGLSAVLGAGNSQSAEDNVDNSGKADSRRNDESSEWGKILWGRKTRKKRCFGHCKSESTFHQILECMEPRVLTMKLKMRLNEIELIRFTVKNKSSRVIFIKGGCKRREFVNMGVGDKYCIF